MAQSVLAILLILSWLGLSRVDLLEDLDFSHQAELVSCSTTPLLDHRQTGRLTNNIVESADRTRLRILSFIPQLTGQLPRIHAAVGHRAHKLNKLHHVFLL